jgi:hypothetical protein
MQLVLRAGAKAGLAHDTRAVERHVNDLHGQVVHPRRQRRVEMDAMKLATLFRAGLGSSLAGNHA